MEEIISEYRAAFEARDAAWKAEGEAREASGAASLRLREADRLFEAAKARLLEAAAGIK